MMIDLSQPTPDETNHGQWDWRALADPIACVVGGESATLTRYGVRTSTPKPEPMPIRLGLRPATGASTTWTMSIQDIEPA